MDTSPEDNHEDALLKVLLSLSIIVISTDLAEIWSLFLGSH